MVRWALLSWTFWSIDLLVFVMENKAGGWRFQGESLALPVRCWENKVSLLRAAAKLFLPFLEESVGKRSVPGSQCFSQLSTLKNDKIFYLAPTRVRCASLKKMSLGVEFMWPVIAIKVHSAGPFWTFLDWISTTREPRSMNHIWPESFEWRCRLF